MAELLPWAARGHAVLLDRLDRLVRARTLIFGEAQVIVRAEIDRGNLLATEPANERSVSAVRALPASTYLNVQLKSSDRRSMT